MPTSRESSFAQVHRFLKGMHVKDGEALLETLNAPYHLEGTSHCLPVHEIPTATGAMALESLPPGFTIERVETEEQVAEFSWVQDAAYREVYDLPRGCFGLFYSRPESIIGPDTIAALVYDPGHEPVRAAYLIRSEGLVSGVGGAVVPHWRGHHLGEPLMEYLRTAARVEFSADIVYHETMPIAMPIARRLGLKQVFSLWRWRAMQ